VVIVLSESEEHFWSLVAESLSKILGYKGSTAKREVEQYKESMKAACEQENAVNVVYHELPIQVACDIAGIDLNQEHLKRYSELVSSANRSTKHSSPAKKPGH
jgi:hypothetical protein